MVVQEMLTLFFLSCSFSITLFSVFYPTRIGSVRVWILLKLHKTNEEKESDDEISKFTHYLYWLHVLFFALALFPRSWIALFFIISSSMQYIAGEKVVYLLGYPLYLTAERYEEDDETVAENTNFYLVATTVLWAMFEILSYLLCLLRLL